MKIPFLGGWTSINPSYFDVNYRGTRFWSIATWILHGFASWLWRLCLSDSSRPAGWVRRSLLLSQAPSITYSVSRAAEVNYIHYTDYTVYMIYMMYWGKFTHESSCAPQLFNRHLAFDQQWSHQNIITVGDPGTPIRPCSRQDII